MLVPGSPWASHRTYRTSGGSLSNLVIFAGAGVSMGEPSNLPDFRGLAADISQGTGTDRQPDEPEDRFLGRLFDQGVKVHEVTVGRLSRDGLQPTKLHRDLLRLFADGTLPRVVTTNFDLLFEEASQEVFGMLLGNMDDARQRDVWLKAALPNLVDSMERREHLLSASAATLDRLLKPIRPTAGSRRRRKRRPYMGSQVPVRTYNDWNWPPPGFLEIDLVAHCGGTLSGSFIHSLVATDICTGWTEAVPLPAREQSLVVEGLEAIAGQLPFPVLGIDSDNDSVFINQTLIRYCADRGIEFTRSRAYRRIHRDSQVPPVPTYLQAEGRALYYRPPRFIKDSDAGGKLGHHQADHRLGVQPVRRRPSCRYTAPGEADRTNCPGQKTSRARPPVTNARMGRRRRELPKQGRAPRNRSKAG